MRWQSLCLKRHPLNTAAVPAQSCRNRFGFGLSLPRLMLSVIQEEEYAALGPDKSYPDRPTSAYSQ
jgi:hypothetical protein